MTLVLGCAFTFATHAQQVGIKSNVLADAFLSPNLGMEVSLSQKFSLDVTGQVNFWTVDNHKWKHWLVQPEGRYWFCQALSGHFVGLHALAGEFNLGNINLPIDFVGAGTHRYRDERYQGWMAGAGVAYGYSWMLHKHWNLEAEIGVGWIYNHYDKYECVTCGRRTGKGHHNYFGPTKAAINIVYIF